MKGFRYAAVAVLAVSGWLAFAALPFDIASTYTVGAWQEREEITIDHKGRTSAIALVWMGVVGAETRDGVDYLWLEARTQQYKTTRKGGRKESGDLAVMKTLVPRSSFSNFTNPLQDMRSLGREMIIQTEQAQPMRIVEGGMMASTLLSAMGIKIEFEMHDTGTTKVVEVDGKSMTAYQLKGTGRGEGRILIKKIKVESEVETWVSSEMPLAIAEQVTNAVTNGKAAKTTMKVTRFGTTGAVSVIDDSKIQDMPTMKMPSFGRP